MRKLIYFFAVCLIALTACKKPGTDLPGDGGCISQIRRSFGVSHTDSVAAANLLAKNGIKHDNLVYSRVILNDTIVNRTTQVAIVDQHIFAYQYFNGLPILNSEVGYHFRGGIFQSTIGTVYTAVNLNTSHHLNLPQVRKLYVDAVTHDSMYKNMYKDTCLAAEFGYYDLNGGVSNSSPDIVKVWFVMRADKGYPQAVFKDEDGATVYYDDGIRTLTSAQK